MTNKFTTPCFVRVKNAYGREELLTWLENIGYDCSTARADVEYYGKTEPVFMVVNGVDCRIQHNRPMLIEEHDCGTDVELFKALSAMNSENDREQWFVAKCDINDHGAILWHERDLGLYDEVVEALRDLFRKATAEELINHFKDQTMSKTIEKAAREFADREYEVGEVDWDALYKGYCWGAKDTLSQPLADRLTAAEKERVRAYYNGETFGELDFIELVSCRRVLDSIFGEDFFKDMSK